MIATTFPAVLGNEISGVVEEVGAGVTTWRAGDRVAGFITSGAYAEFALTTPDRLAAVPAELDLASAATIPTAAEAAQRGLGLLELPDDLTGMTALVNASAGAVGGAAVQLLAARGATVIGTASPENHDYVRALGAIPVRYGESLLDDLAAVSPDGIDVAFDAGGRGFVDQVIELVASDRIVTIVDFAAGAKGARVAGGDPFALTAATLPPVLTAASAARFRVEIDSIRPLDEVEDAHRRSDAGHLRGKILLRVGADAR